MAVDSRDKRASALGFPGVVFSNPDGTISAPDRQQATGLYRGIASAVPVVLDAGVTSLDAGYRSIAGAGYRMHASAGYRMIVVGG